VYKVVHKATSHKMKPSKEKYIKDIILKTHDRESNEEIIRSLMIRMEKHNWIVVLKSLIVFHRCFVAGDDEFVNTLSPKAQQVFGLNTFKSRAPQHHNITIFISKYAKYLEEKASVVKVLGYQFEKNRNITKDVELDTALKFIPKLQSQLNALCNCKIRSSGGEVIAILRGYMMIIKDSIILYTMLHDSMIQLLDLFWKIDKTKASKILSMYKLYVRETNVLISIYNNVRNFFKELPTLKAADESIIQSMEKYVANLEDDEEGHKQEVSEEENREELISTTPGTSFSSQSITQFQNDQNSESEESSGGGDDVDRETDDFFKSIITDFPSVNQSFGFQQPQDNDPFSIFKPTSVPHSTATYEEKLNFIKSIPQTSVSMTTQSLQSPNPFQTMLQPQTTTINPFSDMVNPFANVITSMMTSMTNDLSLKPNPFTTTTQTNTNKNQGNPFL